MNRLIKKLLSAGGALAFVLSLAGCAANHPLPVRGDENVFTRPVQTDIFPGNYWNYSFGTFQKKENFENVDRAQFSAQARNQPRIWGDIKPQLSATGTLGMMQSYFPFDVRWKLKDGREFILENINVRDISNEYLRKNPIQLQWQREGRPEAKVGEGYPILAHEIQNDTVVLKWVIRINRTPVNKRLTATGASTKWDFVDEEHLMAVLKGVPTSSIDFNKTYEPRK
jgi:hypothetical protein